MKTKQTTTTKETNKVITTLIDIIYISGFLSLVAFTLLQIINN